jgi:hypothetical protein
MIFDRKNGAGKSVLMKNDFFKKAFPRKGKD